MQWKSNRRNQLAGEVLEFRRLLAGDLVTANDSFGDSNVGSQLRPERIVGGIVAAASDYGWIASLQDGFGHFCGGTLVSPTAVVTAAHCVEGQRTAGFSVVVGRSDLATASGQRIDVQQIISHPDYNAFSNDADIAVLVLAEAASETPIGFLSEVNESLATPDTNSTVLGWGATREGGSVTTQLRRVDVPIVSNETANEPSAYNGQITENMLAAGQETGGRDSCQGDSGGPLIVFDTDEQPQLAGVVSWGEGCARPNKYGIYARVSRFADWINTVADIDSPEGQIDFAQSKYVAGSTATIYLQDSDLDEQQSIDLMVTSGSGDQETIQLTSFSRGRFKGDVTLSDDESVSGNGKLEVNGATEISVAYADADDGTGNAADVVATADVVVDDFPSSTNGAADLAIGETIQGAVDVVNDTDWFRIEVPAGQGIEISIQLNDATLNDSLLNVYGSDGETLLGVDDDGGRGLGSKLPFLSPESTTIYAVVAGYGINVGTYSISVQELELEEDDHFNIFGLSTPVSLAEVVPGHISYSADADWFQFEAEAGVLYQAGVTLGSLEDSRLRLISSDGTTELAFNDDVSFEDYSSRLFFFVEEPGTYYLEVEGYEGLTGTYEFFVQESKDDHGNLPSDPTPIGPITLDVDYTEGEITPFDVDWFSFQAEANTFYEFETMYRPPELTRLKDTVVELFDASGEFLLVSNDDHDNSLLSYFIWQAPADGEYLIKLTGHGENVGYYEIEYRTLTTAPRDDVGNHQGLADDIDVPDAVLRSIQYEGDLDWFQFEAVEGFRYGVSMDLRNLEDSYVRILDQDGVLLAENDDVTSETRSSYVEWTAETSGTYFIQAAAYDGFLGSYRLRTRIIGDLNEDSVLSADDIDSAYAAIESGVTDPIFDLNNDMQVNEDDVDMLLRDVFSTVRGDADLDGNVEFSDFLALSRAFGNAGGWANGDFSGDGQITFDDFLTLSRNFGYRSDPETRDSNDLEDEDNTDLLGLLAYLKLLEHKRPSPINPK